MKPAFNLYRQWFAQRFEARAVALAESSDAYAALPITERLAQAIWYDQRLRAGSLRTADGRAIKVLSPGFWNLEAGPDFRRALIQFDDEKPRLTDVEVHLRAEDWRRHGHSRDPFYQSVGLHVVLWEGIAIPPQIPLLILQHCLDAPLEELCDAIDPEAYPYSDALHTGRCAHALLRLPPESRDALLEAAGDERLRQKAQKFSRWAARDGFEQALYEGVMEALGYKANKLPMRLLAQRLPLASLPHEALAREAALLGAAGFLPQTTDRYWDAASRRRAKELWSLWWKLREQYDGIEPAPRAWKWGGLRPQNFPPRRLAAAAQLFAQPPRLLEQLRTRVAQTDNPKQGIDNLERIFVSLQEPFWARHYHFGASAPESVALLGRGRARDILVNVVLPLLLAVAEAEADATLAQRVRTLYAEFPRLATNSTETFAAYRLFGPNSPTAKILRGARRQQGLLQLFRDFCLNDSSACARCPLPDLLGHWPRRA